MAWTIEKRRDRFEVVLRTGLVPSDRIVACDSCVDAIIIREVLNALPLKALQKIRNLAVKEADEFLRGNHGPF